MIKNNNTNMITNMVIDKIIILTTGLFFFYYLNLNLNLNQNFLFVNGEAYQVPEEFLSDGTAATQPSSTQTLACNATARNDANYLNNTELLNCMKASLYFINYEQNLPSEYVVVDNSDVTNISPNLPPFPNANYQTLGPNPAPTRRRRRRRRTQQNKDDGNDNDDDDTIIDENFNDLSPEEKLMRAGKVLLRDIEHLEDFFAFGEDDEEEEEEEENNDDVDESEEKLEERRRRTSTKNINQDDDGTYRYFRDRVKTSDKLKQYRTFYTKSYCTSTIYMKDNLCRANETWTFSPTSYPTAYPTPAPSTMAPTPHDVNYEEKNQNAWNESLSYSSKLYPYSMRLPVANNSSPAYMSAYYAGVLSGITNICPTPYTASCITEAQATWNLVFWSIQSANELISTQICGGLFVGAACSIIKTAINIASNIIYSLALQGNQAITLVNSQNTQMYFIQTANNTNNLVLNTIILQDALLAEIAVGFASTTNTIETLYMVSNLTLELNTTLYMILDLVMCKPSPFLYKGYGCDGLDNNCDGIIDDPTEDLYPPSIYLPQELCNRWFQSEMDALNCIQSNILITDDCGFPYNVTYNVTSNCANSTVLVTATDINNNTATMEYFVKIDSTPPTLNVFVEKPLLNDINMLYQYVDPGLSFNISSFCFTENTPVSFNNNINNAFNSSYNLSYFEGTLKIYSDEKYLRSNRPDALIYEKLSQNGDFLSWGTYLQSYAFARCDKKNKYYCGGLDRIGNGRVYTLEICIISPSLYKTCNETYVSVASVAMINNDVIPSVNFAPINDGSLYLVTETDPTAILA